RSRCVLIQPAGRTETRGVNRIRNGRGRSCHLCAETLAALRPRELRWRNSEHALKTAQQSEPAKPNRLRQCIQRNRLACLLAQHLSRACNRLCVRISSRVSARWLTAQARAESLSLGLLAGRKEAHVVSRGPAARAARPAIDARRLHAVDELAVRPGIAVQHPLPCSFGIEYGLCLHACFRCYSHRRHVTILVPTSRWR